MVSFSLLLYSCCSPVHGKNKNLRYSSFANRFSLDLPLLVLIYSNYMQKTYHTLAVVDFVGNSRRLVLVASARDSKSFVCLAAQAQRATGSV